MTLVPKHVAIIMDGNGRWAQRRGHPRVFGHIRGASRIKPIARAAARLGIKALTLYAFSTENWKRPDAEKQVLWRLLKKFLLKERAELHKENVRLHVIGEPERLDPGVRAILDETIHMLSKNTGLQLTFALSYGSRREIARAAQLFAQECVEGRRSPQDMTEELFGQYLWTAPLGELQDVDLVIRTSGEKRVSNYLLWQSAYAEYLFPEVSWPEFSPEHLEAAVNEFAGRSRRFGATGEQIVHTSV